MSQNSIRSRLRRAAWQITPAPILHLVFGARLRGMGRLIDAAAMLTYRAAWMRDASTTQGAGTPAYTAAAAAAKLTATENAQRVIDMALQMFGGRGVQVGQTIEHLYRDIRSLRIYEGASEVQLLILGKHTLRGTGA